MSFKLKSKKEQKKSVFASTLITLLILAMLILSGPAQAVLVTISGLNGTYTKGSFVNFTVSIKISDPDAFVPVSNISVNVTGPSNINRTFALNGTPISGNGSINITPVFTPQHTDFGYGYGYGYDRGLGYGYNFGYGYGYGYGYGVGGGTLTYIYNVTIDSTSLSAGDYYHVVASLNTGKAVKPAFTSDSHSFAIISVADTTPPVITLLGSSPVDVEVGSVYTDAGATAWDNLDGDLTASIVTVNPVNTAVVGTYTVTYNVNDAAGNPAVQVTRTVNVVNTTPPSSVTDLHNITYAPNHINWTWVDPIDGDFDHVEVYLNVASQGNVEKGVQFFNATSLTPDTEYEIGTHTVDVAGNINQTWANTTARTSALPDTTPPASITNMRNISYATDYINWVWTDPSDSDFDHVEVYLNGASQGNVEKGVQFFNATSLTPDTEYEIGTRTADTTGNVNQTWVNTTARTAPAATAAPSAPSGGGGAGGGGVTTSEPYENIAKAETVVKSLIANRTISYTFTAPEHGIYEIAVTDNENENDIAIRVEALKGTSKLVTASALGTVYKNVNIWAGTKKIKEVLIRFKVENSWLDGNNLAGSDVKLVKWDGSKWVLLEVSEIRKDASYAYYEAKTDTLSVFAITGLKVVPTPTPPIPSTTEVTPTKTPVPEVTKAPGFEAMIAVFAALFVAISIRKKRE